MTERRFFVYIMTNNARTVLYIGITNDLLRRVFEHREKLIEGFTSRYNCNRLVYYEIFGTALDAIAREKQLKRWGRAKKIDRIRTMNPQINDLWGTIT